MKRLIVALVVVVSAVVNAGPEEHMQDQKCYNLVIAPNTQVNVHVPSQICLENVTLDTATNLVSIYSYFWPDLYRSLKTEVAIRNTEDSYKFQVSTVLFDSWQSGCGNGENVKLLISGNTDFTGVGDTGALEVKVVELITNDTCHSRPQETVYKYMQ